MRRVITFILIAALLLPSAAEARRKKAVRRTLPTAVSAILLDATANHRYYGKNIDRQVYPASTTKVMTALLVLQKLPLDQYVKVPYAATAVVETKLHLKPGEKYRVRDLLYAVLLKSANDAAIVLAVAVAGSQAKFVTMMNAKARALGARNTRFANAHGLPSKGKQYTTARDMAVIFQAALKEPFFRQAISYKYRIIYSKDGRRFFLKSHNKMLFLDWKGDIYGKTGYTRQAQSCFVGYFTKGSHTYIIGVFGCRKRWDDIKFIAERYGGIDL